MIGPYETLLSFANTLWRSRKRQSRTAFEAWQTDAVNKWLRNSLPNVAFYKNTPASLTDCPIIDKSVVMGAFDQFNTQGLDLDHAWGIQRRGGRQNDLTIGASTGTSGNRGLFVINEREKHRWLGTILAKTMADLIWKPQRVAIILPQDTGLYGSANRLRFIQLKTFPLTQSPDTWRAELEAFDPTIIVAPPKVLRHFAEAKFALTPIRIFSAAETLDPPDEAVARAYFKQPLRQIYMATEGLFAVSCAHDTLHLAEDSVKFEFEPAGDGLVSPLVTTFQRDVQIMARYRMNDLLRLSDAPCPCGSPLQAVDEIVGRMDDMFVIGPVDAPITITPDILRNAVLDSDRRITDFRLIQTAQDRVLLRLPRDTPDETSAAAQTAVTDLILRFGAQAIVTVERADLPLNTARKLRRVERRVDHG